MFSLSTVAQVVHTPPDTSRENRPSPPYRIEEKDLIAVQEAIESLHKQYFNPQAIISDIERLCKGYYEIVQERESYRSCIELSPRALQANWCQTVSKIIALWRTAEGIIAKYSPDRILRDCQLNDSRRSVFGSWIASACFRQSIAPKRYCETIMLGLEHSFQTLARSFESDVDIRSRYAWINRSLERKNGSICTGKDVIGHMKGYLGRTVSDRYQQEYENRLVPETILELSKFDRQSEQYAYNSTMLADFEVRLENTLKQNRSVLDAFAPTLRLRQEPELTEIRFQDFSRNSKQTTHYYTKKDLIGDDGKKRPEWVRVWP